MNTGANDQTAEQGSTWGWLAASVWLAFLAFPLATIVTDDSENTATKAAASLLIVAFAAVYLWGFWQLSKHEAAILAGVAEEAEPNHGYPPFAALVVIAVVLFALVDLPALGVIPFVVAFSAFNFPWRAALTTFAAGLLAAVLVPLSMGALDDLWFLAVIVFAVGGGTLSIRALEDQQMEQARLRTDLALSGERNRVARDVHDVLGHSLTAVILKADLSQRLLDGVKLDGSDDERDRERLAAARAQLGELASVSRSALAEIRSTVGGLRVADLADELAVARSVLADADVELVVTGEPSAVDREHRSMLAWVVREAVTNVVRHARATRCHIEFAVAGAPAVLMRITDDGVGIADPSNADGNGLRGVRERVEAVGARLTVQSDQGTRLEVTS